MNFKALNVKKGLKRFWIVGSVFWIGYPFIPDQDYIFGVDVSTNVPEGVLVFWVFSQIIWWALLYLGFWVARGFVDDDDKKAGF
jgi:hypothetical protein